MCPKVVNLSSSYSPSPSHAYNCIACSGGIPSVQHDAFICPLQNISLSALRKTKRMPLGMAATKMSLTAGKALFFQNLALFIVDEVFLTVRLALEER